MAKRKGHSCGSLRRRDFLALATAGAASVVTGWPESKEGSETLLAMPGGEAPAARYGRHRHGAF